MLLCSSSIMINFRGLANSLSERGAWIHLFVSTNNKNMILKEIIVQNMNVWVFPPVMIIEFAMPMISYKSLNDSKHTIFKGKHHYIQFSIVFHSVLEHGRCVSAIYVTWLFDFEKTLDLLLYINRSSLLFRGKAKYCDQTFVIVISY